MELTDNKFLAVSYKLYAIADGEKELIEETTTDKPYQFISGLGTTLEAFEDHILGLNKGDKLNLTLTSEEAYGDYNEEHVIELPKNLFEIDGKFDHENIVAGNIVPLMNADGQRFNGLVREVQEDIVIMDMNHPLAGAELNFVGEVIENRVATPHEIQGMINMLTHEGGCGCGSSCGCEDEECGSDCGCSGSCGC